MKYIAATLITLIVSFTQNISADWLSIGEIDGGGTVYLESDTIRKADGFIYFWEMRDYQKTHPVYREYGDLSTQIYYEADCRRGRVKTLTYVYYENNMGLGQAEEEEPYNKNWKYPSPNTITFNTLNIACNFSN